MRLLDLAKDPREFGMQWWRHREGAKVILEEGCGWCGGKSWAVAIVFPGAPSIGQLLHLTPVLSETILTGSIDQKDN